MSLILGILDSGGAAAGAGGSYQSIATVNVGSGGAANIQFTSIPQTYTHLQIRAIAKTDGNDTESQLFIAINGSGMTYKHRLRGSGASVSASAAADSEIGYALSNISGQNNMFSALIIDILDYANTNKNRVTRSLNGGDTNGGGLLQFNSTLLNSTTAVSSISFTAQSSRNFLQYSQFALYGIKGA